MIELADDFHDLRLASSEANAKRVYRAFAAFRTPLPAFEVGEADFAEYDGFLQMSVPLLRVEVWPVSMLPRP